MISKSNKKPLWVIQINTMKNARANGFDRLRKNKYEKWDAPSALNKTQKHYFKITSASQIFLIFKTHMWNDEKMKKRVHQESL